MAEWTFANLPQPPSGSNNWAAAYAKFVKAGNPAGYVAWLEANKPTQWATWQQTGQLPQPGGGTGTGASGPVWNPTPIPTEYTGGASFNGSIVRDPATGARSYSIGHGQTRTPLGSGVTPPAGGTTSPPAPTGGSGGSGGGGSGGGSGSGSPGNPGQVPGAGSGSGTGSGGNAGGAQGADRGGAVARALAGGGSDGSSGGMVDGDGYINLGKVGAGLLSAAGWATPFPYSLPITLAGMGMRGINTAETDSYREALGIPGLSVGQALGSVLGWNNYGSLAGNQTIASPEQGVRNPFGGATSPVTMGGMYTDAWGPFDLFGSGEETLAYTPAELSARRSAAAGYAMPAGGWGGSVGSRAVSPAVNTQGTGGTYAMRQGAVGAIPGPAPSPVAQALAAPLPKSPYQGMSPERIAALGLDPNPSAISGGVSYSGNASDPRSPNFGGYGGAITGSSGPMRGGMLW